MFRQNVLEGMLADPMYGGNRDMVGWRWVGFPGDPMRRGDPYAKWVFSDKPYPYEHKPLPMRRRRQTGGMANIETPGTRLMAEVTMPTKVDAVIIGVGWVGGIIAAELTKAGLKVVGLERGTSAASPTSRTTTTSSRYAIRYELFQDTSKETWTLRHNLRETGAADPAARLVPARHGARRRGRALERPDLALPPARLHHPHEHDRPLRRVVDPGRHVDPGLGHHLRPAGALLRQSSSRWPASPARPAT